MQTSLFDYTLPPERIAQHSVEPRDHAKLLVVDRKDQSLTDRHVFDLPDFLKQGDLLIFNDSKVFKARLHARKDESTAIELFLLRPQKDGTWLALAKPGKKLKENDQIRFSDQTEATIVKKKEDGTIIVDFRASPDDVFALADRLGEIPVPPYVDEPKNVEDYQTIYAKERGSVAAPTAGFHFTPSLFEALEKKGVQKAFVTLHVGLGTFRPMKTETLEEHQMHEEWYSIPEETIRLIEQTKKAGHRVIAVGTTAVRALESWAAADKKNNLGFTSLFITPDYQFRVIDGLMTNFHLPKSTLIVLVSSFAGRELIMKAYKHAIDNDYRFYSFGDAMLLI